MHLWAAVLRLLLQRLPPRHLLGAQEMFVGGVATQNAGCPVNFEFQNETKEIFFFFSVTRSQAIFGTYLF